MHPIDPASPKPTNIQSTSGQTGITPLPQASIGAEGSTKQPAVLPGRHVQGTVTTRSPAGSITRRTQPSHPAATAGDNDGMEMVVSSRAASVHSGTSAERRAALEAEALRQAEQAEGALITFLYGAESRDMVSPDVLDSIRTAAQVMARHGIRTTAALEATTSQAFGHDTVVAVLKSLVSTSGYLGLMFNALIAAPKVEWHAFSESRAFVGAMTVSMTMLTSYIANGMAAPLSAAGQESMLPASVRERAAPLARATANGLAIAGYDTVRQLVPVGRGANYWRLGEPVVKAVANRHWIIDDACSRILSAVASSVHTLRGLGVGEPTHQELLWLQDPMRLGTWLGHADGKGVAGALASTVKGNSGKAALGALDGGARFFVNLPANVPLILMGAAMISVSLLAAAGRAAEHTGALELPPEQELARSVFERRAIFAWAGEMPLEFALCVMPAIIDHLTNGGYSTVKQFGDKVLDATQTALNSLPERLARAHSDREA